MKLIISIIVSLTILELFHCTPLIGNEDGSYKETNTSSSWGFNAGVEGGAGLEAGWKDGHGVLGVKKHLGANIEGHKENSQKDTYHTLTPVPAPNNYGPGFGSQFYPGNNLPYYQQFPSQFPQQASQRILYYVPQPIQQYPQWSQFGPHYAQPAGPQFGQQFAGPQFAQPYGQQFAQPYGQQFAQPYGQQFAQPYGQQFAQPLTGPQFAQQPANLDFTQQPTGPQFAQQPTGSQFAQQPAGREFDQQPTAYIPQGPQFTQQRMLPAAPMPQQDGSRTKSP